MIPSSEDVQAMKRLRAILDGAEIPEPNVGQPRTNVTESQRTLNTGGRAEVDAMAEVLRRFYAASGSAAEKLLEDSQYSPQLREAIQTRATDDGAIIGNWQVRQQVTESQGKTRKLFDVVNPASQQTIYKGLVLFEAAHAIVKYLNKGMPPNDKNIKALLDLEEQYNRNRIDAARFKQRYQRCQQLKEREAGEVFANRFQVARAQALAAQDQIKSILESIR